MQSPLRIQQTSLGCKTNKIIQAANKVLCWKCIFGIIYFIIISLQK